MLWILDFVLIVSMFLLNFRNKIPLLFQCRFNPVQYLFRIRLNGVIMIPAGHVHQFRGFSAADTFDKLLHLKFGKNEWV